MELRVTRRWAHWGFGLVLGAVMLGFGNGIIATLRHPEQLGEGIRIIIPPYLVLLYPVLAVIANYKTAIVRPDGVMIKVRPFPTKFDVRVDRGDIRLAYARTLISRDEGQEVGRAYSAGVETRQGLQFDVTGPQQTIEVALMRAEDIARILNVSNPRHQIKAAVAAPIANDPGVKRRMLTWMGAILIAVLVGAAWEIKTTMPNIRYSGPGSR
jgi:hypothetical protein